MEHADQNLQAPSSVIVPVNEQPLLREQQLEKNWKEKLMEIRLFQAAMKHNVKKFKDELKTALKNDSVADSIYHGDKSLIHVAAKYGNAKVISVIAKEHPFLLTKRDSNLDTVLHIAVKAEDESVFNVLTDIRKDLRLKSENGWKDISLTAKNSKGNTALHEALLHRRKRMAEQLMLLVDQDVFFSINQDEKSALYLSVEAGYLECVIHMLQTETDKNKTYRNLQVGKSAIHAAVEVRHTEILKSMLAKLPLHFDIKDEQKRSPLHLAAARGALPMVRELLKLRHGDGAYERDINGMMPIHHAAENNCVDVMKKLLLYQHDPCDLVIKPSGESILHIAAKCGRYNAVRYILKSPNLKMLLNQVDDLGNTPLHLASKNFRPRIVSALTWDDKVNVELRNKRSQSALDVHYEESSKSADNQVLKQMLTWAALKAAKTPKFVPTSEVTQDQDTYKDRVNTLLLVSTLAVTVTFAAGFTMPGAYNGSEAQNDPGMAINLNHVAFQVFVICNTVAMYSAMLVVVVLMWAQLGDFRIMKASLQLAIPLLGSALSMMCMAFMTGVYVTINRLRWIAIFLLVFGCSFLASIAVLFFLLGFPVDSNKRFIRFATYYLIYAMLRITGNLTESRHEMPSKSNIPIIDGNDSSSFRSFSSEEHDDM